jgi:hypothetical protein
LSELIADVEPRVSVERSRFMIAFALASCCVPPERIAVTTAGRPGRDRRDGERDGGEEDRLERLAARHVQDDRDHQGGARDDEDLRRQLVELPRQRRGLLALLREHPGDVAHLRRHPGRRDDELAGAAGHVRVHVDHVGSVAERRVRRRHGLHALRHGQALAGERRLGDLQRRRLQDPAVRGDDVARLDLHDVAGHELLRGHLNELPAAADLRLDDHHLLERGDGGGRLALLVQAEDGVEQRQEEQDEPVPSSCSGQMLPMPATSRTICIGSRYWRGRRASVARSRRRRRRSGRIARAARPPPPAEPGVLVDAELQRDGFAREREPLLVRGRRLDECRGLAYVDHGTIVRPRFPCGITRSG